MSLRSVSLMFLLAWCPAAVSAQTQNDPPPAPVLVCPDTHYPCGTYSCCSK